MTWEVVSITGDIAEETESAALVAADTGELAASMDKVSEYVGVTGDR